jgi:uncharacterized protein YndB with AHSA1/START domain
MATIRHHTRIDRSADDVWKVVADPVSMNDWFPGLDGVTFDGAARHIPLGDQEIVEEIVTVDDALRRFQYRIIGGPMVPSAHLATIDVLDDSGSSIVVYSCDVEPDDAAAMLGPIYAQALDALRTHLEG